MIEIPPRIGSKRFREILVPAFKGDPIAALAGLYWMTTRRRGRGWSQLMVAASKAPLNCACWIQHGETMAFADFRRHHPRKQTAIPIIALLLDEDSVAEAVDLSVRSIRTALNDPVIYAVRAGVGGLKPLPQNDNLMNALSALAALYTTAWLLPICPGDQIATDLGDILARSLEADSKSLVYWDEDHLAAEGRSDPWVKPDWDPLLFGRLGGLLGASVVSLAALERVAGHFLDAQINRGNVERLLFDLHATNRPKHIPLILTHRGKPSPIKQASPSISQGLASWPSVSIIIPTRDKPSLLAACLNGIGETDYPGPIQIIVVDNASSHPAALELLDRLEEDAHTTVLRDGGAFNFSRLNNLAANAAHGELLCLLNNDVEPLDRNWLANLVSHAVQEGVGAVGAQLVYPSGRIQHAGVAIGLGGAAGHVQKGVDPADSRFWTWHAVTREVSALTAAVLVVKSSAFAEVAGFDQDFAVAFNDIDFCLRLKQRGFRNIYVAEARLLHRESESRGKDRSRAQARRFASELTRLQERWGTETYCDPHFSPLFSRLVERCVLAR